MMPPVSEEMEMHEHVAMQAAEWFAREKHFAEEMVASAAQQLKFVGLATTAVVKEEEPKQLLLREAESWNADCIFVGARGPEPSRTTFAGQCVNSGGDACSLFG